MAICSLYKVVSGISPPIDIDINRHETEQNLFILRKLLQQENSKTDKMSNNNLNSSPNDDRALPWAPPMQAPSILEVAGQYRQEDNRRKTLVQRLEQKIGSFHKRGLDAKAEAVVHTNNLKKVNDALLELQNQRARNARIRENANRRVQKKTLNNDIKAHPPIDGKWKITNALDQGSSGYVCEVVDIFSGNVGAAKFEKYSNGQSIIQAESTVYMLLKGRPQAVGSNSKDVEIHFLGRFGGYNCMVMDPLGTSLSTMLASLPRGMPVRAVMNMGLALIDRIEALHSVGITHCDVKPANIVAGMKNPGTWHLIDFNMSNYVCPETGESRRILPGSAFQGTYWYASVAAHMREPLSKATDLESLAYVLIHALKGTLPWLELPAPKSGLDEMRFITMKEGLQSSQFVIGLPVPVFRFLSETRTSPFVANPNYELLRDLLRQLLVFRQALIF